MANMSYCRFRNTLSALQDCYEAFGEFDEDLGKEEKAAARKLLQLCKEIGSWHEHNLELFGADPSEESDEI